MMKSFNKLFFAVAVSIVAIIVNLMVLPTSHVQANNQIIGVAAIFYSPILDKYFVTAESSEIEGLKNGSIDSGSKWVWKETFPVIKSHLVGAKPVCRFVSNNGVDSTHVNVLGEDFSIPLVERTDECAVIQKKWPDYWLLEHPTAFYADVPVNGSCPVIGDMPTYPLYRIYRAVTQGGPNHFFTTNRDHYLAMSGTGTSEGIAMCVAGVGTLAPEIGTPPIVPPVVSGGNIDIQVTSHIVTLTPNQGQYFGFWEVGKDVSVELPVDVTNASKVCFRGERASWDGVCAPVVNNVAAIVGTKNSDEGSWTLETKDGKTLWIKHSAFKRSGLVSKVQDDGLVRYGVPASLKVEAGGRLVMDFGSTTLIGFTADLTPSPDMLWVWNSNKEGWDRMKSNKRGKLELDTTNQKYRVVFEGLSCSDKGNVSVYLPQSGTGNNVIWQGAEYAWFLVRDSVFELGAGVTFDEELGQVEYTIPGCT